MPPNSSTSTSKWILGAAALVLAGMGAFNYAVDPFQQYRLAAKPRYWHTLQRYIVPGLAKNGGYEAVLLGSSMFEGFRNSEATVALGGQTRNLSMSAISAYEEGLVLDLAFRYGKPKRVVIDLNVNTYAGPVNKRWFEDPLPLYLWDRNPFNDVRYLWSLETFEKSAAIVRNRPGLAGFYYESHDQPWAWTLLETFSARAMTKGLDPTNINERYQQPPRTLEEMAANFDANILPHILRHPETRFDLVHPPYSVLAWADFEQRKQVEVTLAWKRALYERVKRLPNAAIFDFQSAPPTDDLNNYKDIYHYSAAVSSWMLSELGQGERFRVTDANVEPVLEAQRHRARSTNVRALLANVR